MSTDIDLPALLEVPIRDTLDESEVKQILASAPFLPIPQALNLRSISGPSLQPGIVYRSGTLSHMPTSSLSQLKDDYNIATIFDLRSKKEREKYPSPEIQEVETIWIPSSADVALGIGAIEGNPKQVLQGLSPADFAANNGVDGYVKMYGNILVTQKDAFKTVFEKLKEPQGGLLFHCTAGKDRTGILAALILGLVDAPPEIIARDYALTRIGTEPFRDHLVGVLLQHMTHSGISKPWEEPGFEELCGVRGQTILAVLEWMARKWGDEAQRHGTVVLYPGVHGYLTQELNFSAEDLQQIKRALAAK